MLIENIKLARENVEVQKTNNIKVIVLIDDVEVTRMEETVLDIFDSSLYTTEVVLRADLVKVLIPLPGIEE